MKSKPHESRLEEVLDEYGKLLRELKKAVNELKYVVGAIGEAFSKECRVWVSEAFAYLLEKLGVKEDEVKKFKYVDESGEFIAPDAVVEAYTVTKGDELWVIGFKGVAEVDDVLKLYYEASIVEKVVKRRVNRKVLLTIVAGKDVLEAAKRLGVEVVYVTLVEED